MLEGNRVNHQEAMDYIVSNSRAVLTTIKRDGRAQMSLVDYGLDEDGLIKIQTTLPAAKTKNAQRDPRVSLSIVGDDWGRYLVVEGRAALLEENPLPTLRHVYQLIAGQPHPDWSEFDQAMIEEQQVVMAIEIERVYPIDS